jgi:hypothetical protein
MTICYSLACECLYKLLLAIECPDSTFSCAMQGRTDRGVGTWSLPSSGDGVPIPSGWIRGSLSCQFPHHKKSGNAKIVILIRYQILVD